MKAKQTRELEVESAHGYHLLSEANPQTDLIKRDSSKSQSLESEVKGLPDRRGTGRRLAQNLSDYADRADVLVLTLPRGVPIGLEIAEALNAPLDIFIIRELDAPAHTHQAVGAIATGMARVVFADVVTDLGISSEEIDAVAARELRKLKQRERAYRGKRPPPDVQGQVVIFVHDGSAPGSTIRAAAAAIRKQNAKQIIIALPAVVGTNYDEFQDEVDGIVNAIEE